MGLFAGGPLFFIACQETETTNLRTFQSTPEYFLSNARCENNLGDGSSGSSLSLTTNSLPEDFKRSLDSLNLKSQPLIDTQFVKRADPRRVDIEFSFDGLPLCEESLHMVKVGKKILLKPKTFAASLESAKDWKITDKKQLDYLKSLSNDQVEDLALDSISKENERFYLSSAKSCLFAEKDKRTFIPGIKVEYHLGSLPYSARLSGKKLTHKTANYFHVDGRAKIYKNNSLAEKFIDVKLRNLTESGYLCGSQIYTSLNDSSKHAFAKDFNFSFSPDEFEFEEVSAYANTSLMLGWFKRQIDWEIPRINVFLDNKSESKDKGPYYSAGKDNTGRFVYTIFLPPEMKGGGEVGLNNLRTDFDVVSHELAHHIVAQYVGFSDDEEHTAVHEGLADFFVFAITNNACLAESVCKDNLFCWETQCLRTALNSIVYEGPEYEVLSGPHHKSMVLSGFLWDLVKEGLYDREELSKKILSAVPLLDKKTSFGDVVSSLEEILALDDNPSKLCKYAEAARKRGFESYTNPPSSCN